MSFQGLTPEALVTRNDSKNPSTTCKGLTVSGRPCRRSLGASSSTSPSPSPGNSPRKGEDVSGVLAILNEGDAAAFFCWQHKDQAENLVAKLQQSNRTRIAPLQKRSSIDTLAEKVGIISLEDVSTAEPQYRRKRKSSRSQRPTARNDLPEEWKHIEGPLMSVPEEVVQEILPSQSRPSRKSTYHQQQNRGRPNAATWGCCFQSSDYQDDGPPPRRRERHQQRRPSGSQKPYDNRSSTRIEATQPSRTERQMHIMSEKPQGNETRSRYSATDQTPRRSRVSDQNATSHSPPHAQTQSFLSIIPQHLNPATTSALLAELTKPFAKDDEAGYIYIFWLTPDSDESVPDDDVASTILEGDLDQPEDFSFSQSSRRLDYHNQPSRFKYTSLQRSRKVQQLNRFASVKRSVQESPRILLKIGRAQNVHRRLTQWTKQCNQNITLVRYYPHYASRAAQASSPGGTKVPHVNRVERLIHLELRGIGWGKDKELCNDCGREHREWFEVPATKQGLRTVDEVVKRWVNWAESST